MAKIFVAVVLSMLCFSPCLATKRMMTGGITTLDSSEIKNNPIIKRGVENFLKKLNQDQGSPDVYKLICGSVPEASSQVVQGALYRVKMEIIPVPVDSANKDLCIRDEEANSSLLAKKSTVCFTIWSRPWLDESKSFIVQEQECQEVYNL